MRGWTRATGVWCCRGGGCEGGGERGWGVEGARGGKGGGGGEAGVRPTPACPRRAPGAPRGFSFLCHRCTAPCPVGGTSSHCSGGEQRGVSRRFGIDGLGLCPLRTRSKPLVPPLHRRRRGGRERGRASGRRRRACWAAAVTAANPPPAHFRQQPGPGHTMAASAEGGVRPAEPAGRWPAARASSPAAPAPSTPADTSPPCSALHWARPPRARPCWAMLGQAPHSHPDHPASRLALACRPPRHTRSNPWSPLGHRQNPLMQEGAIAHSKTLFGQF